MGHVFVDIELSNSLNQELNPVKFNALTDTGALCLTH